MNRLERAALEHAKAWLRYQRSPQYQKDLATGKAKRAELDRASGHSPKCNLTKCHPECKKG